MDSAYWNSKSKRLKIICHHGYFNSRSLKINNSRNSLPSNGDPIKILFNSSTSTGTHHTSRPRGSSNTVTWVSDLRHDVGECLPGRPRQLGSVWSQGVSGTRRDVALSSSQVWSVHDIEGIILYTHYHLNLGYCKRLLDWEYPAYPWEPSVSNYLVVLVY